MPFVQGDGYRVVSGCPVGARDDTLTPVRIP